MITYVINFYYQNVLRTQLKASDICANCQIALTFPRFFEHRTWWKEPCKSNTSSKAHRKHSVKYKSSRAAVFKTGPNLRLLVKPGRFAALVDVGLMGPRVQRRPSDRWTFGIIVTVSTCMALVPTNAAPATTPVINGARNPGALKI